MKHAILKALFTFIVVLALAMILSIVDFGYTESRDYTGITEHCIPDIAYDASFNQRIVESGNRVEKYPKVGLKQKTE